MKHRYMETLYFKELTDGRSLTRSELSSRSKFHSVYIVPSWPLPKTLVKRGHDQNGIAKSGRGHIKTGRENVGRSKYRLTSDLP